MTTIKIEFEKDKLVEWGFIAGTTKGWPAETWAGDRGFPESYDFKIYSPGPNQVKVDLKVRTSANHYRSIEDNDRKDLKKAIAEHYQDRFPNCLLVFHD